ncbi:MAG: hypothetical protein ABJL99_08570 [Aliishimia sp.]
MPKFRAAANSPYVRTPDLRAVPKTLVFDTSANYPDFRCQKPLPKSNQLLMIFERPLIAVVRAQGIIGRIRPIAAVHLKVPMLRGHPAKRTLVDTAAFQDVQMTATPDLAGIRGSIVGVCFAGYKRLITMK